MWSPIQRRVSILVSMEGISHTGARRHREERRAIGNGDKETRGQGDKGTRDWAMRRDVLKLEFL